MSNTYYSPTGNPEVWKIKPDGYYTVEEWQELNPPISTIPSTIEEVYLNKLNEAKNLHDAIARDTTYEYSETEKQSFYLQQAEYEIYAKVKTETPELLTLEYCQTNFTFCFTTSAARGLDFSVFMDKVGLAVTKNKAPLGLFMGAKQRIEDLCKEGLNNGDIVQIASIDVVGVFNTILSSQGLKTNIQGKLSLL